MRLKLQEIIDAEDKTKPLSDDAAGRGTRQSGRDRGARTVTKYRKAMNIPSSRQRRVGRRRSRRSDDRASRENDAD